MREQEEILATSTYTTGEAYTSLYDAAQKYDQRHNPARAQGGQSV